MSNYTLLRQIRLGPAHQATGNTRHFVGGELQPAPFSLQIVKFSDDPGFYLLYCDHEGVERTDTWHATLEDAFSQAQFEFQIAPHEWAVTGASDLDPDNHGQDNPMP